MAQASTQLFGTNNVVVHAVCLIPGCCGCLFINWQSYSRTASDAAYGLVGIKWRSVLHSNAGVWLNQGANESWWKELIQQLHTIPNLYPLRLSPLPGFIAEVRR